MTHQSPQRFAFDLARIAPDWPDAEQRLNEWRRVIEHYLPRLQDFFGAAAPDPDTAEEVVSHIIRRALLKLHEIGDQAATWNWMVRTGKNYLLDLQRRQRVQTRLRSSFEAHLTAVGEDVVSADVVLRVLEASDLDGNDAFALRGRIPIDRATYETRLNALSPDDRRLLELIQLEGKTHAEAAAILGLASPAASRKRHSRACEFIRRGARAP